MNAPLAYLNGRLLPFAEAALSLHDAGFVSGATVVDNARTFRHRLFRWSDHLARFRRDCTACYVPLHVSDEQLTATAEELVAHNAKLLSPGGELQLVTFATPGPLGFYLGESVNGPATLGMATYPLPFARYSRFFADGVTLALVGTAPPSTVLPPTVKHRSRMLWHVADHRAREQSGNLSALGITATGPDGTLTETGVGHFLAVIDGTVTSPPRDTVLDGISLRVTEELCRAAGVPFAEASIPPARLKAAAEAMLTGTGFCLAGVRQLFLDRSAPIRFAWPGPAFRTLLAAWSDLVGVDVAKQFTEAGG